MLYQFGLVKWFNEEQGYGFILQTGPDLYFSEKGHRLPKPGSHNVYLPWTPRPGDSDIPLLIPGTEVCYVVGKNDRGFTAEAWCLAEVMRTAQSTFDLGMYPCYRIVRWLASQRNYRVEEIWKGRDLSSPTLIQFPLGLVPSERIWFQVDNGKDWINCPDPRLPTEIVLSDTTTITIPA